MIFPSTRAVLFDMLNGVQVGPHTLTCYYHLQPDFAEHLPAVQIINNGGTEGYVDRVDRISIDVYAEGTQAEMVGEAIRACIVPGPHDTDEGFLDSVSTSITPHDIPYPSDRVNLSSAEYRVTVRPV